METLAKVMFVISGLFIIIGIIYLVFF
ncbi:hypothetical protein CHH83_11870 [Bacillus sp. 7586-K]|nr:hypothetical protein CHH83_11870 [Bacillus sp. 7586-K]